MPGGEKTTKTMTTTTTMLKKTTTTTPVPAANPLELLSSTSPSSSPFPRYAVSGVPCDYPSFSPIPDARSILLSRLLSVRCPSSFLAEPPPRGYSTSLSSSPCLPDGGPRRSEVERKRNPVGSGRYFMEVERTRERKWWRSRGATLSGEAYLELERRGKATRHGRSGVMEAGVDIVWHYRTNFPRRTLRYWFRRARPKQLG